ncbi:DUF1002 domain-containing protein [Adhaeretor mobilis]|uniref:Uncharacterized protein n=1 Tax=Adhaeretor mobilis TaxID=1930276 RepID=A0A517N0T3_9BACT|nr:DUF1002 domain-containing protein [Adhaeretor mobilis]QDT00724.1 hypothetical protein HG15A2_40640 [Adhaeretor mobilis]
MIESHHDEHSSHEHGHAVAADHEEVVTNLDRPPLLSWGAILGGLACMLALSWLLGLLGLALGVSIADVTDGEAVGQGMLIGTVVWLVLTALIAYFVSSMLAARLSGKVDDTVGMLHGFVLWGVATTVGMVLGYYGIKGLLQTGYSAVETTTSVVATTASGAASGVFNAGAAVVDAADTPLGDNIQARLKRRAASVVAEYEAEGGVEVDSEEVESAIESLSADDVQEIATLLVQGEITAARESLADKTDLSTAEIREIVEGISNQFEEQLGTDENKTELTGDVANSINRRTADFIADLDARGGAEVSQSDVSQALEGLTPETLRRVSIRLFNGNLQSAKDVLVNNTNLTTRQVNDIVDGVNADVSRKIEEYQTQVSEAAEAASTYAQSILWIEFIAGALGLAVSILGGWLGAETSRTLYAEIHHNPRLESRS